jgi:hypothetical protein
VSHYLHHTNNQLIADCSLRFNAVGTLTESNQPTPPDQPVRSSPAAGSLVSGDAFDDGWWLNATGANGVIDRVDMSCSADRVLGVAVLYGDKRAALGTNDTFFAAQHGSTTTGCTSLVVPRGVRVSTVRLCADTSGVRYLSMTLSDGRTGEAGNNTTTAVCNTYAPPTPNATVAGVYGRAGKDSLGALGLWWY